MAYTVRTRLIAGESRSDPTVFVLEDGHGSIAEVWPGLGFNCFRWEAVRDHKRLSLLYADPALFQEGRPTRSGIPVLFPFPNRIRGGKFDFEGRTYQLELTDSSKLHAIHGFACRQPWRVIDYGADTASAWVTGEFRCSVDAPASLASWPADHQLRLTVRLGDGLLRLEAEVHNPDTKPLPWGLGYHPYFCMPFDTSDAANCTIQAPASEFWVLDGNLPTGERRSVDKKRDLNSPRNFVDLQLDDVLTTLPSRTPRADGLIERGTIHAAQNCSLRMYCSPVFRELVVFTPPHRQAFALEPYTCTTNAANLGAEGGWRVLAPGATERLVVELSV